MKKKIIIRKMEGKVAVEADAFPLGQRLPRADHAAASANFSASTVPAILGM